MPAGAVLPTDVDVVDAAGTVLPGNDDAGVAGTGAGEPDVVVAVVIFEVEITLEPLCGCVDVGVVGIEPVEPVCTGELLSGLAGFSFGVRSCGKREKQRQVDCVRSCQA